jgi:hypothetical protein
VQRSRAGRWRREFSRLCHEGPSGKPATTGKAGVMLETKDRQATHLQFALGKKILCSAAVNPQVCSPSQFFKLDPFSDLKARGF